MSKIDEIKAGGVHGAFGIDQIDWGGRAGKFYEFWKVEPCCGSPLNAKDAIVCLGTWWCCPLCAQSKLYASSLNDQCGIVPHALFTCLCSPCSCWFTRYNLRKKLGVKGNLLGDFVCVYCCGCCSSLQHLRASAIEDWFLFPCNLVPAARMELIK